MKLHKFKDINEYKEIQEKMNIRKLHAVFVNEEIIDMISKYINDNIDNPSFGICHGTRRGMEQKYFSDKTGANVIGTEISSTATQFPNTIEWDFHEVKDEWIDNIDFIYSNSIDHSYNPDLAIDRWLSCLKRDGYLFIEYTRHNKNFSEADCFAADYEEMKSIIEKHGTIVDVLVKKSMPPMGRRKAAKYKVFVVKKGFNHG